MQITILGCGASPGVPFIGCDCAVCTSDNPKNKRRRVSVWLREGDTSLLIDTSPDLRMQALDNNIRQVDAVLYTHEHGDHSHGIDDLKRFNALSERVIPIYGDSRTLEILKNRFAYAFSKPTPEYGWVRTALSAHEIQAGEEFTIKGIKILPFSQIHGKIATLGYRIGGFAYSTDVNALDEAAFAALEGVEVWVVDCQGRNKAFTHSHLEQTLEWIERVKPKRAVLTHMAHDMEYEALKKELPDGVEPAFDNMSIEIAS